MSAAVRQLHFVVIARVIALSALLAVPVCSVSQGKQNGAKAGKNEEEREP